MINEELEYLYKVIQGVSTGSVLHIGLFDRLFSLGIVTAFAHVNTRLEKLSRDLDNAVSLEGISIDFDKFLNKESWSCIFQFADLYSIFKASGVDYKDISYTTEINGLTDYLPPVVTEGEGFRQSQVDSFKSAMHQLCDEEKLAQRTVQFSLAMGVEYMFRLLKDIKKKVEKPKSKEYLNIWNELSEEFEYTDSQKVYEQWKDEQDEPDFDALKARQKLEIFNLLNTDFFMFISPPTVAEVRRCRLKIEEEDLPVGTVIPDDLNKNCTIFEKFIEWKGSHIMTLKYEKLGKYIYHNYKKFKCGECYSIVYFDRMLDLIHYDMARLKPELSKYLKNYEQNQMSQMIEDCIDILSTCEKHLKENTRNGFLRDTLYYVLNDKDMKEEATRKLKSNSRNKYLIHIIAALSANYAFKADALSEVLAGSLSEKISSANKESIKDYIDKFCRNRESKLYVWMVTNYETIKAKPYDPFEGLR